MSNAAEPAPADDVMDFDPDAPEALSVEPTRPSPAVAPLRLALVAEPALQSAMPATLADLTAAAERRLLGSVFADEGTSLDAIEDAGITPPSFYVPAHRVIYDAMRHIRNDGQPVAVWSVAEALRRTGQLSGVGDLRALLALESATPTTAYLTKSIDAVAEFALRRDLVRRAAALSEAAQSPAVPIDEIGQVAERIGEGARSSSASSLRARLKLRAFDPAHPPEASPPRFLLQGKPIATEGNLSNIMGQAKGGKSAFVGAVLAAAIAASESRSDCDALGVTAADPDGRQLLVIDTEQSPADVHQALRRVMRRARVDIWPAWLRVYGLAGFSAKEMRAALRLLLRDGTRDGLFAVVLDGAADFIADVNNAEESNEFIGELHGLAIEHRCPIFCVIHENPGADTGKMRGHFGSQAERKAESNLRVKKVEEISVVYSDKQRGAPILEKDGSRFRWDDAAGMHVSIESAGQQRDSAKVAEMRELAAEVFETVAALTHGEICERIVKSRVCAPRTAERHQAAMKKAGVIRYQGGGKYVFCA